jgi:hypothetical protein
MNNKAIIKKQKQKQKGAGRVAQEVRAKSTCLVSVRP